ncbi:putative C2 domain protein [Novymonas esmeraldas]|uniref:C2 domain protein n=1 Tax=Novymonas esmeraldas TaxID=1808958 RepID=A0AAW0F4Z9_9TRYP
MPSPRRHSRSSPSRRSRASAGAAPAQRSPRRATHRSRHTSRRSGEEDGKPYYEVVETVEEVTTRARPSTTREVPRLEFHGDAGAPRGHAQTTTGARRHNTGIRPPRASGLVESPADVAAFDDYDTPPRRQRPDGRYTYADDAEHHSTTSPAHRERPRHPRRDQSAEETHSRGAAAAATGAPTAAAGEQDTTAAYVFRVRLHECQGVFADLEASHRTPPAVYFAVHTAEERGHSGVVDCGGYNPVFNDEFIFSSADPERDALVCTLVTASPPSAAQGSPPRRDKKVAECVLALHNLAWQVERRVWVPLVRRAGTAQAYEQGEVLVSIYSEDFGYDEVATEEEEAACSASIRDTLTQYAPQELHRLDWMTAAYVNKGSEALAQLRASYRARTIAPVPVRVVVKRVDGLVDDAGCPTRAPEVYVVVSDGRTERRSRAAPYRGRATINQEFRLTLANPEVDTLSVTVFGGSGRKLAEAVAGLTNVQAGKPKELTLLLVRAAETGDASNGGQVALTLQTEGYSSPYQLSAAQEARLRERVLAYLWCYLRDDLHRLDALVGSIDDEEVYMQEWVRTVGPEQPPRRLSVSVRGARNAVADEGGAPRCYARITAGPTTVRTGLATVRRGAVAFNDPFTVKVYDPALDAVEVMLIAEDEEGEKEVGRVCFGVAALPRHRAVVRTLHLVADAAKRSARVQGELTVELLAEDFGLTGAAAEAAVASAANSATAPHVQRLEAITQRSSPETLHRVPYVLDTAPVGEVERVVEAEAKQHGDVAAVAPMTVRILGVKAFKPAVDFYVKVYLNKQAILRTGDVKGSTEVPMDIDNDNEATVRLTEAPQAVVDFKIAQHRALRRTVVLGEAEVALAGLVRGEKNVLWLPFFRPSKGTATSGGSGGSASCVSGRQDGAVKVKGDRMQDFNGASAAAAAAASWSSSRRGAANPSPVGLLGVELQSSAFPGTTVTEYKLDSETGRQGVSAQEAVTHDVTSLIAKMRPSELSKVQPMMAQCTSLKDAHEELRTQLSPTPIAATVYVNIESVDLATDSGRAQEARGAIGVSVVCGGERHMSRKQTEFANDVLRQRQIYTQVRLDIPERVLSAAAGRNGEQTSAPALELRLVGLHGGDGVGSARPGEVSGANGGSAAAGVGGNGVYPHEPSDAASDATADSYYVGGENNIQRYRQPSSKTRGRRWSIKPPEEERTGRPSKMLLLQQRQQQTASYADPYTHAAEGQQSSYGEEDERYFLGGANHIRSYVDSPGQSRRQSATRGERTPSHRGSRPAPTAGANGSQRAVGGAAYSRAAAAPTTTAPFGSAAGYRGEIGVVRLSLRALLTSPVYKVGDTLRVPIVAAVLPAKLSYRARRSPEVNQRCVVGHVTLRLMLPAFERVPELLRLGGRQSMTEVAPDYVHYYERRIGAYLRSHNAPDLVAFHYNLYERDVASGCWPVSLHDWLQALVKRFGAETEAFAPPPALPFDPETWERARQRNDALRREREAAFAASEHGSNGVRPRRSDIDRDDFSSRGVSPSGHSRGNSPTRAAVAGKKARATASSGRRRGAGAETPAEPVYSF